MWKPYHPLKRAVCATDRLYLLRCLYKYISSPVRTAVTSTTILRNVNSMTKYTSSIYLGCRYNHSCNPQTLHICDTPCDIMRKRGRVALLSRPCPSSALLECQRRGVAIVTRTDHTSKVPLAKSAPLRRRKKQSLMETDDSLHHRNVVSYVVGEELNLVQLRKEIIVEQVYDIVDLPRDIKDTLMVTAKYKVEGQSREAFFFSDGGIAFWHMSESERHDLWKMARSIAVNAYDHHLIVEESESLFVVYDSTTKLVGDTVYLKTPAEGKGFDEEVALHKYTFSNALSQSVNLAMSEANLQRFIDQLEPETHKLRHGVKSSLRKKDINMKLGEVFQLRHEVNLESGFLDNPDIYWEREDLEGIYRQMISYLSMPKRIRVLNERLNYCSEILQLFNSQQNDQHHIRLEWIIIILILIEVIFECIHYAEKYGIRNVDNSDLNQDLQE